MELPGSMFLATLATVSITFVGFSALLVVFRQSMGGALTRYDTYFTLSFIQVGFIVTAGGLMPLMFAAFDWRAEVVWRVASGLVAIPIFIFVATVPARRRAATNAPVPPFIRNLLFVQGAVGVVTGAGATGLLRHLVAGVYCLGMLVMLVTSGIAYFLALSVMLPTMAKPHE